MQTRRADSELVRLKQTVLDEHLTKRLTVAQVAPSAIYKFMKKKHLIRKPQKKQTWYTPLKEPYYAVKPGENVQLDVKFVPSVWGEWKYQFRFIDTVSICSHSA